MGELDLSKAFEAFRDAQREGADDEEAMRHALPHILVALAELYEVEWGSYWQPWATAAGLAPRQGRGSPGMSMGRMEEIEVKLATVQPEKYYEHAGNYQIDRDRFDRSAPRDMAWLVGRVRELESNLAGAWDAGYAAAILDIGQQDEPPSINPWHKTA